MDGGGGGIKEAKSISDYELGNLGSLSLGSAVTLPWTVPSHGDCASRYATRELCPSSHLSLVPQPVSVSGVTICLFPHRSIP